jgi:hypothetical protein
MKNPIGELDSTRVEHGTVKGDFFRKRREYDDTRVNDTDFRVGWLLGHVSSWGWWNRGRRSDFLCRKSNGQITTSVTAI